MEFKYRAVDEQPYRQQTASSSGCSYFTEQAIRAGYRIPGSGRANEYFNLGFGQANEYFRNPIGFRETIERELEKERIRREIIAAEIARRQALEADVRRLRARGGRGNVFDRFSYPLGGGMEFMPREVPFQQNKGRLLEERIAMSLEERLVTAGRRETGGFEMVPFQQGSIELKIKEARPSPSLSGVKRKAVPPEEETASELLSNGVAKKKVKEEEWSCVLCQVTASSERGLNDHIQGKKHKSKEAALRAQMTGNYQAAKRDADGLDC